MELQVVEINEMEPSLLYKLVSLERQAFGEGGLNEWTLPIVVRYGKVFALKRANKICGLAEFIRDWTNPTNVFLIGFSVEKNCQRRGFGKHFLKAILDKLRTDKVKNVFLTVSPKNIGALKLYEQFGFREVALSIDEYGEGEHRAIMKLELGV